MSTLGSKYDDLYDQFLVQGLEVERLTAEVERLREFIREFYGDAANELIDAEAEVERLRKERDGMVDDLCEYLRQRGEQEAVHYVREWEKRRAASREQA